MLGVMSPVLDIVALRSYLAVADCGGFHRAAAALHLTQSAVSQHVRKLEKTVGRALVERDGRRARFTGDGELLLSHARRLLAVHDDALRQLAVDESATLTVGSLEHAADQLIPELVAAMREAFPDRDIRFRLDRSARLTEAVDNAAVDIAVVSGGSTGGRARAAGMLTMAWFVAPDWKRPRGPVPLVLFDEPCASRRLAMDALVEAGVDFTVICEAADLAGVLAAARSGLGVALLPATRRRPDGLVESTDLLPPPPPAALRVKVRPGAPEGLAAAAASAVRAALAGSLSVAA